MAISTELVVARHGEAVCNVLHVVGGERGCNGLTDLGRRQAAALANRLAAEHNETPFDVIYSSPRLRVRQTAKTVASFMRIPCTVRKELRGPDHGQADGMPWGQIKDEFGGDMRHQPHKPIADGGDSWASYLTRATADLKKILTDHSGQRVLIIGHGETIEAAHTLLLGLPAGSSTRIWFSTGHTAIARWKLQINKHGRATWLLDTHNDTGHLTRLS